jgi:glycosyltransferase involved in cell wall biosynthesis
LREIEIIVVDDGSEDGTHGIVEGFASHDPRIRLMCQRNGGVGAARNTGIQSAHGEFIAPLDADDLWEPDKLEKQVCRMRQCGEKTAMIYCWSRQIDEGGNSSYCYPPFTIEGDFLSAIILRNFLGNASVPLLRAEALEGTGFYLTKKEQDGVQGCEDWDLSIRISERWQVGLVPEILVSYRQVKSCMSAGTSGMSASYRLVMERARQRNNHLPEALFRWSEGHFQSYLVSKSYGCRDFKGCLAAVSRSITADPAVLLNWHLHSLAIKSFIWLAAGNWLMKAFKRREKGFKSRSSAPTLPARVTLFERIQERRWTQVVEGKA